MAPIKQQFEQIEWLKVIATAVSTAILVTGIGWTLIEQRGDNRWAARNKTESEIKTLSLSMAVNEKLDEAHHNDTDLHMSAENKRATFVTRHEWLASRTELKEDIQEIKESQKEQRALSIEILNRLTK